MLKVHPMVESSNSALTDWDDADLVALSQRRCNEVEAVYLGGSRAARAGFRNVDSDIDLRLVVPASAIASKHWEVRRSRCGARIYGPSTYQLDTVGNNEILVELLLMPSWEFTNRTSIIRSHWQFAASSNLFHGRVLYDRIGHITALREQCDHEFSSSSMVADRINYVAHLARKKLGEFQAAEQSNNSMYKELRDGPLWALISIGNLACTWALRQPTGRWHWREVRSVLQYSGELHLLQKLRDLWGMDARHLNQLPRILNAFIGLYHASTVSDSALSSRCNAQKCDYYVSALRAQYKNNDMESAFSLVSALGLECGAVLSGTPGCDTRVLQGIREILTSLGMLDWDTLRVMQLSALLEETRLAFLSCPACDSVTIANTLYPESH